MSETTPAVSVPYRQFNAEDVPAGRESFENSIRRGGASLRNAVGGFFGLTNESLHGYGGLGWENVLQRRTQEGGLLQSLSTLRHRPNNVPSSYHIVAGGHSFNPDQMEVEEDDVLVTEAPPDYSSLVHNRNLDNQHQDPISAMNQGAVPVSRQLPSQGDLIYDSSEAYAYYQRFVQAENRIRKQRRRYDALQFFGGDDNNGELTNSGTRRRGRLQSPQTRPKRSKLQRQNTLVRQEVESLPTFWPVCIVIITIAQIATMITILVLTRPPAPINVKPVGHVGKFPTLTPQPPPTATNTSDSNSSFSNNIPTASVMYYLASNLWIGPRPVDLIQYGAKFSPCMRNNDYGIGIRNAKIYSERTVCCVSEENIGITQRSACPSPIIRDVSNSSCVLNGSNILVYPNFHPCCLSIVGGCNVTSKQECDARKGFFNESASSCDEVNCIRDMCGFNGKFVSDQNGKPYLPKGNQFWRWFTSLFVHLGVLHMVLVIPIQLYAGIKIERTIGWLRIGLIYLISGVGGNILSGIFAPYEVNGGSSAAVLGLVGVLYVELFQFWQIVDRAWLELIKLTAFLVIILFLGTFPFVDNWAHLGGLLFGVISGIVFVPYITFGKLDAVRKRIIFFISLPLLVLLFAAGFATFYLIGGDFCPYCRYINCIPYTKGLCTTDYADLDNYTPAM